nr:PAS domain-containing protein [uncultured Mucilaginibacter sp.]
MNTPETESIQTAQGAMLRTLIDNLPDTIYVKDSDGRKIIANRADVRSLGASSESEVLGKTDIELYEGEIGERGFHDDMEVLRTGKPLLDVEEFFYDEYGKKHWLLTSKVPVHDSNGAITHLLGIGHNITARKRAEESLRQAYRKIKDSNDTLRDLAWSNSHEIRKPVCSIFSLVDLLKQTTSEDERNQCLEMLERCARELDDVIRKNSDKMNTEEFG